MLRWDEKLKRPQRVDFYIFYSSLDAPVVATMPHFLNADERYGLMIDGLNPSMEKHNILIDVEINTGTPLRGGKKLQFNMFLKKIDQISKIQLLELSKLNFINNSFFFLALTENFEKPRLFPVLWVEEGLELNDEMTQLIKDDLVNVLLLINILQWTFVGIGVALIIGMLIWFFIARKRKVGNSLSVEPIYPANVTKGNI